MTSESKGIWHWKLGDVALARMCKKVYTKVRVIKDEKGLFFDDKGLYPYFLALKIRFVVYFASALFISEIYCLSQK